MDPAVRADRGVDLLVAVRRHPFAFLVPIVALAIALGVYGQVRDPEYTAEARIAVGRLDVQTQGLPGFTQAGASIAAAYARAIDAPAVAGPAAAKARVTPAAAADALTASPIPSSPLIRVEAKTGGEREAVDLANAGAEALVAYAKRQSAGGGDPDALLTDYSAKSREVRRLQLELDALGSKYERRPTRANRFAFQAAAGKEQAARLARDAAGQKYSSAVAGGTTADLLSVLAPATAADDDRDDTRNKLALTGALAGVVIGLALAAWRERRAQRRAATGPVASAV